MTDVKETLRQYILTTYLPGESAANLRDDTPLRTSGILDSLATLEPGRRSSRRSSGSSSRRTRPASTRFDRIEDIAAMIARKKQG